MDIMIAITIVWLVGIFTGFLITVISRDIIAIIKYKENNKWTV